MLEDDPFPSQLPARPRKLGYLSQLTDGLAVWLRSPRLFVIGVRELQRSPCPARSREHGNIVAFGIGHGFRNVLYQCPKCDHEWRLMTATRETKEIRLP